MLLLLFEGDPRRLNICGGSDCHKKGDVLSRMPEPCQPLLPRGGEEFSKTESLRGRRTQSPLALFSISHKINMIVLSRG